MVLDWMDVVEWKGALGGQGDALRYRLECGEKGLGRALSSAFD